MITWFFILNIILNLLIHSTPTFQTFTVSTGSSSFTLADISCRILQGSVFGLFPFCFYMLPLGNVIQTHNISCHCYTDGRQIPPASPPSTPQIFLLFSFIFMFVCVHLSLWSTLEANRFCTKVLHKQNKPQTWNSKQQKQDFKTLRLITHLGLRTAYLFLFQSSKPFGTYLWEQLTKYEVNYQVTIWEFDMI